jgi:hypothetical protein
MTLAEARGAPARAVFGARRNLVDGARHHGEPFGAAPLADLHGVADAGQHFFLILRFGHGKRGFLETGMGDEHAHLHLQVCQGPANGLLLRGGTSRHAVVLPRGEALVEDAARRVGLEHARVGAVAELEARCGGLRQEAGRIGEQRGAGGGESGGDKGATIHGVGVVLSVA